jgi:ArsR family transcriptional regulator, arsenate/arsenite/antimonite-responsive transcriptional repressor
MTHSKNEKFDPDLQEVARFSKSLSHPARLAILEYLAKTSSCISGDISNEIPLSRSTVNQHLAELKNIGVIKGEIEGVKVNYCIDYARLNALILKLNTYFSCLNIEQQTDCKI